MPNNKLHLNNESDSRRLAEAIAANLTGVEVITLSGGLGAGKTTFARALINSMSKKKQDVISPTFNIVQIYDTDIAKVWHYDLYRIKSLSEIAELGLEEAAGNGVVIVEWPEMAGNMMPAANIHIKFDYSAFDGGRTAEINCDKKWDALLNKYANT